MSVKEFQSLTDFCLHLGAAAVAVRIAERDALEEIAAAMEKDAREQIGTYQAAVGPFPAWVALAPATVEDRVRQGFSPDQPLLRTGQLRDSISHEVDGSEAVMGSTSDIAAYQEFGTSRIPPRPFIGPAAVKIEAKLHSILGQAVLNALEYGGGGVYRKI